MAAVVNNPELKLARDQANVAHAQAFAAGLLPDPQLAYSNDTPVAGPQGSSRAMSLGLNYDVSSLFTRSVAKEAAAENSRSVELNLLWQEWQVISQARLLFVRSVLEDRLLKVLQDNQRLFEQRYALSEQELKAGNTTLDAASAYLAALESVNRQINDLQRQTNANRYALTALLGLAPETRLHLVGDLQIPPLDEADVRRQLADLPKRRPDLLALQAGYRSQELQVRRAILQQYPSVNIGIAQATDTSNVTTQGFGIALSLPFLNGNRGNIAIEKATRQFLFDEYQVRLNSANSEVRQLLKDHALIEGQLDSVQRELSNLRSLVSQAEAAFEAGNIDVLNYATLRAALLGKQAEAIALEGQLLEQRVGLSTLTGGDLPGSSQTKEAKQ
jgi:outer membrane protein TolC